MVTCRLDDVKTILCVGSHADDIEIGCGGTLMQLLARNDAIKVCWVVLSASGARAREARRSARMFLRHARHARVVVRQYRDTALTYDVERIKAFLDELGRTLSPDLVFTHRREDVHQDHRLVSELTWRTFRDHMILEYEIPKYEGDLGTPNVFVPLDESTCRRKVETILDSFATQRAKPWFSADTFWALLRIRGVESNSPTKFAEALTCRKVTLSSSRPGAAGRSDRDVATGSGANGDRRPVRRRRGAQRL